MTINTLSGIERDPVEEHLNELFTQRESSETQEEESATVTSDSEESLEELNASIYGMILLHEARPPETASAETAVASPEGTVEATPDAFSRFYAGGTVNVGAETYRMSSQETFLLYNLIRDYVDEEALNRLVVKPVDGVLRIDPRALLTYYDNGATKDALGFYFDISEWRWNYDPRFWTTSVDINLQFVVRNCLQLLK